MSATVTPSEQASKRKRSNSAATCACSAAISPACAEMLVVLPELAVAIVNKFNVWEARVEVLSEITVALEEIPAVLVEIPAALVEMFEVLPEITGALREIPAALASAVLWAVVIRLSLSSTAVFTASKFAFTASASAAVPFVKVFGTVTVPAATAKGITSATTNDDTARPGRDLRAQYAPTRPTAIKSKLNPHPSKSGTAGTPAPQTSVPQGSPQSARAGLA